MRYAWSRNGLERENRCVLTASQALLGLIAPSVEAVAIQVNDDGAHPRLWVHDDPAEISEDIIDAIADMEALLLSENPLITNEVLVGNPAPDAYEWAGRFLYWAKMPDEDSL